MRGLWLPATDTVVAAQFAVVVVVVTALLVLLRHRPQARWLVAGLGALLVALMALRALH